MKRKFHCHFIIAIFTLILISIIFSGCKAKNKKPIVRSNFILGTTVDIILYDSKDSKIIDDVFDRLRDIEDKMTINAENTSEIIRLNEASGMRDVEISPDTFYVLEKGLYYSELSEGKFDITIGTIVKLWNIGTEYAAIPNTDDLKNAMELVNYKKLHLDEKKNKARLDVKGMKVDLGAIAKGYAADEAAAILKKQGIKSAIINLGGNILTIGRNPNGEPFKIGVQDPFDHRGDYLGILSVENKTVVTSGIYEKFFESGGKQYHHILDPETGFPAENELAGVSIITDISIDGDGLSTTIFLFGLEKGLEFVNNEPNVEAVFITKSKKIYLSEGIKDNFTLTDKEYNIIL